MFPSETPPQILALDHPVVLAILDRWPGAKVVAVRVPDKEKSK